MGRAQTRSRPDTPGDDDLATRHAALIARAERLLDRWEQEPPCGDAIHEGVNLSEQMARLAVAYEDDRADECAAATWYAAGVAEGERRAAARQRPVPARSSIQDPRPVVRLIPGGRSDKPQRVSAARLVTAAAAIAAATGGAFAPAPVPDPQAATAATSSVSAAQSLPE